jgi:hypothetical protein
MLRQKPSIEMSKQLTVAFWMYGTCMQMSIRAHQVTQLGCEANTPTAIRNFSGGKYADEHSRAADRWRHIVLPSREL